MQDDIPTIRAASERLDHLLRQLDAHVDPAVREAIHEAVALLMAMHRDGLERALALAGDETLGGPALLARFADDPHVAPLLLVHDLHPYPVDVRLRRALDRLRPQIAGRGCRAAMNAIDGATARVRIEGHLAGARAQELRQLVETAIFEAAPEITKVAFDDFTAREPALIQILRQPPSSPTLPGSRQ
jgi:hypothetical protein